MIYAKEETLKKGNSIWKYTKMFFVSLFFGLILTIAIALAIGFRPVIVAGGSMEPTLSVYDLIIIYKPAQEDIKVNDIVTYNLAGSNCTHRVIEINQNGTFVTKGDANNAEDTAPISYNEIIGKVYYTIPSWIGYFFYEIPMLFSLILGAIFLCLSYGYSKPKKVIYEE